MKKFKSILFLLVVLLTFLLNIKITATDLFVVQCYAPTANQWLASAFRVRFQVGNQNMYDAAASTWRVNVSISGPGGLTWFRTVPGVDIVKWTGRADLQTTDFFNPTTTGNYSCTINIITDFFDPNPINNILTIPFFVYGAPSIITSPSPVNASMNVPITAAVGWTNGSNPFSETDVFFVPSPSTIDFNGSPAITSTLSIFNSYDPPGDLLPGQTYNWGVKQINGAGYTTNGPFTFTTVFLPPSVITNINPPNHTTNFSTNSGLSWTNGNIPATQTKIFVTTSPTPLNFNGTAVLTSTIPINSYTPPQPWQPGTTYNWGVQLINSGGTTNNGPFDFTTAISPPGNITNIFPTNHATNVATNTGLSWTNSSNPISQTKIFIVPSPSTIDWNGTAVYTATTGITAYTPSQPLQSGTMYYWGVQQINSGGTTNNGPFDFTTITSSPCTPAPVGTFPSNGAQNIPIFPIPSITWTNTTDPNLSAIRIYLGTTQSAVDPNVAIPITATLSTTSYKVPDQLVNPNSTLFWRIGAVCPQGTSYSGINTFTFGPDNDPYIFNVNQIDNEFVKEVFPEGLIDITAPLGPDPKFISIIGYNYNTQKSALIVDNLFYPSSSEVSQAPTFTQLFNFSGLLNNATDPVPNILRLQTYVSTTTIEEPFSNLLLVNQKNIPISLVTLDATYGTLAVQPTKTNTPKTIPKTKASNPIKERYYRETMQNLDLNNSTNPANATYAGDKNACVPTATANSIKWLESYYSKDIKLPADMTLRKTLETLSAKMKRENGKGVTDQNMILGKLDFFEQYNLPIEVKFQSNWVQTGNISSTSGNSVARNFMPTGKSYPTWEFLLEQMRNGEDVEINYGWYNQDSSKWFFHSVVMSGIQEYQDGKKRIGFKHDGKQKAAGGTKEEWHTVTIDEDGAMRFGQDLTTRNYVSTVVAESPIPLGQATAAWLNELFVNQTQSKSIMNVTAANPEILEFALISTTTDLNNFKVTLYDGTTRKQYLSYTLNQFFKSTIGNVTLYYATFLNDDLKPPPAGIALSYSGSPIPGQFLSYCGSFIADDGDASGLTSINIGDVQPGYGFALSGSGTSYQNFGWIYTNTSTAGLLNDSQTYTDSGPAVPVLNSPTNLTKNQNTSLTLSWNAAQNAQSYDLQYSPDNNFINTTVLNNSITTTSKDISSLSNGIKYYWRTRSKNSSGVSAFSNPFNFSTKLLAPNNLTSQVDAQNKVRLNWNDQSTNEDGFAIERKLGQANFSEINRVNQNILTFTDNSVLPNNSYSYRVMAYNSVAESDYSNISTITVTSVEGDGVLPTEFKLYNNYPNPFNPSTEISFAVPKESKFKLIVYNLLGQIISEYNGIKNAGLYNIHFNAGDNPSGIYIYTLTAESLIDNERFSKSNKMLLIK